MVRGESTQVSTTERRVERQKQRQQVAKAQVKTSLLIKRTLSTTTTIVMRGGR